MDTGRGVPNPTICTITYIFIALVLIYVGLEIESALRIIIFSVFK